MSLFPQTYLRGLRETAPLLLGILPFGMIAGTTAHTTGLDLPAAMGTSLIIFAGASQLAFLEMVSKQTPWFVVLVTPLIINTRFLIYSIAMAPHFRGMRLRKKAFLSYFLVDQAYLLSINHFRDHQLNPGERSWYYLGTASGLWVTWQFGTLLGIILGGHAPQALPLDFAVPLSFIALLVPALRLRADIAAALAAAVTVILARNLPFNLGFLVAIAVGIAAGLLASRSET